MLVYNDAFLATATEVKLFFLCDYAYIVYPTSVKGVGNIKKLESALQICSTKM